MYSTKILADKKVSQLISAVQDLKGNLLFSEQIKKSDVVVCDYRVGINIKSIIFLFAVRWQHPEKPIILYTSESFSEKERKTLELCGIKYIHKSHSISKRDLEYVPHANSKRNTGLSYALWVIDGSWSG